VTPADIAKRAAGAMALDLHVRSGMKLGLGSGSTSHLMVQTLGERVRAGLDVVGVATSTKTAEIARAAGIRLLDLDEAGELDLALDGADEIDPRLDMIKGGGASLLYEKIVAHAARRMVAIVDESKLVKRLGRFPLPVEVIPFGWDSTARCIRSVFACEGLGGWDIAIRGGAAAPVRTDAGNFILDCALGGIGDPARLGSKLNDLPGVVEHGLFVGYAGSVVVGRPDGSATELFARV
jgi:ribose 5-phosphate isomerase A